MDQTKNVAILGLGLMGASLGLALKERGYAGRIMGYARREETCAQAVDQGVVDQAFSDPCAAVQEADLVVICVPIWSIAQLTEQIVPALKSSAIVTDVGSTKSVLLEKMAPCFAEVPACFIGSHPICGSEKTGLDAGVADLYDGRLTIVCPEAHISLEAEQAVVKLWRAAGAEVVQMPPKQHDAVLAATSHLPHMVAAALARSVANGNPGEKADFCGTGFKDTTRVASGSVDMWVDIIDTNRAALEEELNRFHDELKGLIQILRSGQGEDIRTWLEDAAADRDEILRLNRFLKR